MSINLATGNPIWWFGTAGPGITYRRMSTNDFGTGQQYIFGAMELTLTSETLIVEHIITVAGQPPSTTRTWKYANYEPLVVVGTSATRITAVFFQIVQQLTTIIVLDTVTGISRFTPVYKSTDPTHVASHAVISSDGKGYFVAFG